VIKSFLIESINDVKSTNEDVQSIDENVQSTSEDVQLSDHQNNLSTEPPEITRPPATTRSTRARRLSLRYQNVPDITVFLQDENPHSNQFEDALTSTSIFIFENSRRKEIKDLLERRVFELIIIENVPRDVRIFNSRFVDEIKHLSTSDAYEKFRLVVQAYNNQGKTLILTQSSTNQRMSQRIILALAAIIKHNLYLRDITQAYVQSKTPLNREFFIRPPFELNLPKNSILRVVKPLYGMPEAGTH
jgi:hypothetical protein